MNIHRQIEETINRIWKSGAATNDVVEELAIALASIAMIAKPREITWDAMKSIVLDELERAKHILEEDQSHG
jgi:hypothetical protein